MPEANFRLKAEATRVRRSGSVRSLGDCSGSQHAPQFFRRNPEVRAVPDDAAIAKQNGLGTFVPDAEPRRDLVGDSAMRLNGDHLVTHISRMIGDVRVQLIEGFTADAARAAVLEEKNRACARLDNSRVERSDIGQRL